MSKRGTLRGTPSVTEASDMSLLLQSLQEFPDVWSGWQVKAVDPQENGGHTEGELVSKSNFTAGQPTFSAERLRKAFENPIFIEFLRRGKADMERASQAPLRSIVIHYRAEEPLYPSNEVMLHPSVHQAIREFLVLCSRQGRIRPEHPQWPVSAEGFTLKVIRNPISL